MLILFASVFSASYTTTQPTMDYDASNVPCPMKEKTRPGMHKDDEYFEPFDGDYNDNKLPGSETSYDYYKNILERFYYDEHYDIGDYDYNDNKLPAEKISYDYYKNILELGVVKNLDMIFTVNSLIQQLQHKINVLSSYIH
ncbi:hypothetical protein EXVG_00251 [Emiliania huxleyi virus 202]|nr:hypothetical protein EXVG_00251 [Emiliania huxleyi virus 202]AHA54131.1 hypothetical protein EhV18_00084 [Emiliania huxleyi virus 18]AHA55177.1 hypothetical protein EhV156_00080 [Emiliania huxleyi virus 156]